ncbi:hypothetical protein Tco_0418290 [Tanacetum coccineum]
MMGIPNEHQLKFNSIKDAKLLLEAIEKRFGRNVATKKTQRNLLKQRNKPKLETMSMDDLYNNPKVYEPTQVSAANSTNIDNLSDDVICAFFSSQMNKNKGKMPTKIELTLEQSNKVFKECDGLGKH